MLLIFPFLLLSRASPIETGDLSSEKSKLQLLSSPLRPLTTAQKRANVENAYLKQIETFNQQIKKTKNVRISSFQVKVANSCEVGKTATPPKPSTKGVFDPVSVCQSAEKSVKLLVTSTLHFIIRTIVMKRKTELVFKSMGCFTELSFKDTTSVSITTVDHLSTNQKMMNFIYKSCANQSIQGFLDQIRRAIQNETGSQKSTNSLLEAIEKSLNSKT